MKKLCFALAFGLALAAFAPAQTTFNLFTQVKAKTSAAAGDTYFTTNSGGTISRLPIGSNGQCYVVTLGLPAWASCGGGGGLSGGTTNRVPYWTSSTAIGNSDLRYDSSATRFGIGVTPSGSDPILRLDDTANGIQLQLTGSTTGTFNGAKIAFATTGRTWNLGTGYGTGSTSFVLRDDTAASNRIEVDSSGNVGIGTAPSGKLDVNGDLGLPSSTITLSNGLNSDISLSGKTSLVRASGPSGAFSVGGFTGGHDGRVLILRNTTTQQMTLVNADASSSAANRIYTLRSGNAIVTASSQGSTAILVYESSVPGWIVQSVNPGAASPLTTKGDLWGFSTLDARIPVGADGDVLTADSSNALGVSYQTPSGGGGGSLTVTEVDASPSVTATTITFPNDTVTNSGGGVATISDYPLAPPTGMAWWFKADGTLTKNGSDQVSQWNDESGNSQHLVNASCTTTCPVYQATGLNGNKTLRFTSASSQFLKRTLSSSFNAVPLTVYVVARLRGNGSGNPATFTMSKSGQNDFTGNDSIFMYNGSQAFALFRSGGGQLSTGSSTVDIGLPVIWAFEYDGTFLWHSVNSTFMSSTTTATTAMNFNTLVAGARMSNGSAIDNYNDVDISEIIGYYSSHTLAQRSQTIRYLKGKYGISF